MTDPPVAAPDEAQGLLAKIRDFADGLNPEEREFFAVLIGPGVEALLEPADDEVAGFSNDAGSWAPGSLRDRLASAATSTEWQLVERR